MVGYHRVVDRIMDAIRISSLMMDRSLPLLAIFRFRFTKSGDAIGQVVLKHFDSCVQVRV